MKKSQSSFFINYRLGINFTAFLTILILITSCTKKISSQSNQLNSSTVVWPESEVLVLQNDEYISVNTDKKPEPNQENDQFYRALAELKYPPTARANGIQGSVMFEVVINKMGQVTTIKKLNSLSSECDRVAEDAINRGSKMGFKPYEYNGKIVNIKYLIPINFRLE